MDVWEWANWLAVGEWRQKAEQSGSWAQAERKLIFRAEQEVNIRLLRSAAAVLTDGPMGDAILAMFVRTVQTYGCNGFKYNIWEWKLFKLHIMRQIQIM